MRDTPISEKAKCRFTLLFANDDAYWVPFKVARDLEQQLAEARAHNTSMRDELIRLMDVVCDEDIESIEAVLKARGK